MSTLLSVGAPLTRVQRGIFMTQGSRCYRLPFVLPLPAGMPLTEVRDRVRNAAAATPGLSCRFEYDPVTETFRQTHDPDLAARIEVPDAGAVEDVEAFCADPAHQLDLRRDAPVGAWVVTTTEGRFLVLEFHHIAVDGIALADVEQRIFADLPTETGSGAGTDSVAESAALAETDPRATMAAYELVAAAEEDRPWVRSGAWTPLTGHRPPAGERLARVARTTPVEGLIAAARQARALPRVLLQAWFEVALARVLPGTAYASTGNWRWSLGIEGVAGNFPALLHHDAPPSDDLAAAVARLMDSTADPVIAPDQRLAEAPLAVYSFEQFGYRYGRFIPVDAYPKFPLYLRAVIDGPTLLVAAEYDRRLLPDDLPVTVIDTLIAAATAA